MSQRLPRNLLRTLAVLAVTSFTAGIYLENRHLEVLQNHPISVNLLSGAIGFSTVSLVVGVVFNWFADQEKAAKISGEWAKKWNSTTADARLDARCALRHLRKAQIISHEPYLEALEPGAAGDRFGMAMSQALETNQAGPAFGASLPAVRSCLSSFRTNAEEMPAAALSLLEECRVHGESDSAIEGAEGWADRLRAELGALPEEPPEEMAEMQGYAEAIQAFAELYYAVNVALDKCAKKKVSLERG